jgi:hypothetical protein
VETASSFAAVTRRVWQQRQQRCDDAQDLVPESMVSVAMCQTVMVGRIDFMSHQECTSA